MRQQYILKPGDLAAFRRSLQARERSRATVEKYLREAEAFLQALDPGRAVTKEQVLAWKESLAQRYAVSTVNGKLAALNSLFAFLGWQDCQTAPLRRQRELFRDQRRELTRGEYLRLVEAALALGKERLALLLETICATGIRVSELPFITVEAVAQGEATVKCKGKTRTIFIPAVLCKKLRRYTQRKGIQTGPVFVTRTGKALNRSNVWREMKALCARANVPPSKVFPHSLRHLFARCFYAIDKDISKLADILGHSNINTTRIYIISTGAEHRQKMERMQLIL